MNLEKFTTKSAEAIQESLQLALKLQHATIEPLHLLQALLAQTDGIVPSLLQKLEISSDNISKQIDSALNDLPSASQNTQPYYLQNSIK